MTFRLLTAIGAALLIGLGTWVEVKYRRRVDQKVDDFDLDDFPNENSSGNEDDALADIIRDARPALERATKTNSNKPDYADQA
jgi:hypothetical protein